MFGLNEVIDFTEEKFRDMDFSTIIKTTLEYCGIKTDVVELKILEDLSYRQSERYVICNNARELYEFLDDLVEGSDCKNGLHICETNILKQKYFCIFGSPYYDKKTDECRGIDNIKVFFNEHERW